MTLVYLMIWGVVVAFGLSAVYGLVWALRTGQFRNFAQGAASIFDEEEPIGVVTDVVPPQCKRGKQ